MLPNKTSAVLQFLGFVLDKDFEVSGGAGSIVIDWFSGQTQPIEQEIIDAGNDLTTVNGQVFSEWRAENGGNPTLTKRRKAKEEIDTNSVIKAFMLLVLDELNTLRAEHGLPARTAPQLRTAILDKITDGSAD